MRCIVLIFIGLAIILSCKQSDKPLVISQNKSSRYRIIYGDKAPAELVKSIGEFKEHLKLITGAEIMALSDIVGKQTEEILIGKSNRSESISGSIPFDQLGNKGYYSGTMGSKWVITGNSTEAIKNGLYDILNRMGCTKLTDNLTQFVNKPILIIDTKPVVHIPTFSYRQVINPHSQAADYRHWNQINIDNQNDWGTWGYSCEKILPSGSYLSSNPNYFAVVQGKTVSNQINFSNPVVLAAIEKNLDVWSMVKGRASYWSISPYENHIVSEDELTQKAIAETGSASGALLKMVNAIAEKNKNRTHAVWLDGQYRKAPTNLKLAENIMVVLDTKDVNNGSSLETGLINEPFRKDLAAWKALTRNIAVIAHVTNEVNFMMPYPCLNAWQQSMKYLKKEGVEKIILSGISGPGAPASNLNFYVTSQLAYNADQSVDSLIWKYCDNYYGRASRPMMGYFQALEKAVAAGGNLTYDQTPGQSFKSWLSPNIINQLYSYFNTALPLTEGNSDIAQKVDRDRLALIYTQLDVARAMGTKTFGYFMNLGALRASLVRQDKSLAKANAEEEFTGIKNAEFKPIQGMKDLLGQFVSKCDEYDIKVLDSKGNTPYTFSESINEYISQPVQLHSGFNKGNILLGSTPDFLYGGGDGTILNDGVLGLADYPYSNWLGLKGGTSELTWDLGKDTSVNNITLRFLQSKNNRGFLPQNVTISTSTDGTNFSDAGSKSIPASATDKIESISFALGNKRIKAIKIKTTSLDTCPAENVNAGSNTVVLMDEMILR